MQNRTILQMLYFLSSDENQIDSARPDTGGGLDLFEYEMCDRYNVLFYDKLEELAKIIPPYGSRLVQPVVNIFGGLTSYSMADVEKCNRMYCPQKYNSNNVISICNKHLLQFIK